MIVYAYYEFSGFGDETLEMKLFSTKEKAENYQKSKALENGNFSQVIETQVY